jgi:hypothetical protein
LHTHFVNPTESPNAGGLGDTDLGFKWAFLRDDNRVATFQLRAGIPTGNPDKILGNGHFSLEPAFLLYQRLNDRFSLEAELRDWIPIGGTDVAGNILRYGAGVSYRACQTQHVRFSPVVELVGWTVLNGKESIADGVLQSAAGDTIINAKMGLRMSFDQCGEVYVGYGRALTGDVWYKNLATVEYRLRF